MIGRDIEMKKFNERFNNLMARFTGLVVDEETISKMKRQVYLLLKDSFSGPIPVFKTVVTGDKVVFNIYGPKEEDLKKAGYVPAVKTVEVIVGEEIFNVYHVPHWFNAWKDGEKDLFMSYEAERQLEKLTKDLKWSVYFTWV